MGNELKVITSLPPRFYYEYLPQFIQYLLHQYSDFRLVRCCASISEILLSRMDIMADGILKTSV